MEDWVLVMVNFKCLKILNLVSLLEFMIGHVLGAGRPCIHNNVCSSNFRPFEVLPFSSPLGFFGFELSIDTF